MIRNATAIDINVSRRAKKEAAPHIGPGRPRYPSDLVCYPNSMGYIRQVTLIRLLAFGFSDKEIAHVLGVTRNSAKGYVVRLKRITGVGTRAHFTALAVREGLVTLADLVEVVEYVKWTARKQEPEALPQVPQSDQ